MQTSFSWLRRTLAGLGLALLGATAAQAEAVTYFVPYGGQGNVSVFDASTGTGGWVGSIDQAPDVGVPAPLSLVTFVLFTADQVAQTLTGTFEFTTTDLLSTLFGELTGSYGETDILSNGGQFSLDYTVLGGTGQFAGASGYGLSFVDFNPRAPSDNYQESGLLLFTVPTPSGLALLALGLAALALQRRSIRRR